MGLLFAFWVILCFFFACCSFFFYFKINFFKIFVQECHQSDKQYDPDQARNNVGSDLGPDCWQQLSADDTKLKKFSSGVGAVQLLWLVLVGFIQVRK